MNLILGVCGSIACYRAADLARDLMRAGFEVRVCLTDAAAQFVTPVLFETLTGNPCLSGVFEEPVPGRMAHIDWARWADVVVIAPATANTLNKLAAGVGDDMLTTLVLAGDARLVIAPAMNPEMYAQPVTQAAVQTLIDRGAEFVEPTEGDVVAGERGSGKLALNSEIVRVATALSESSTILAGQHVVITSGPTEEPIDDVRVMTNRSSGKMGSALARAALMLGARVTLVTGPTHAPLPPRAEIVRVRTAAQMLEATRAAASDAQWIVGAAAVADYRPAEPRKGKLRRSDDDLMIRLVPNPDIIATLAAEFPSASVVGFAAEPDGGLDVAREKIVRKGLRAIAVNDISKPGIGFDSDANELTLVFPDGRTAQSGRHAKLKCAIWLWEHLVTAGR